MWIMNLSEIIYRFIENIQFNKKYEIIYVWPSYFFLQIIDVSSFVCFISLWVVWITDEYNARPRATRNEQHTGGWVDGKRSERHRH